MIFPKIRVLRSHGRQAIPTSTPWRRPRSSGTPRRPKPRTRKRWNAPQRSAPRGAITAAPLTLDLGRCLFCGECARVAPRNIRFTNDLPHRFAHPRRGRPARRRHPRGLRSGVCPARHPALLLAGAATARGLGRGDASVEMENQRHGKRQLRPRALRYRIHGLAATRRRRSRLGSDLREYGRGAGDLLRRRCRAENPRDVRFRGVLRAVSSPRARLIDRRFLTSHPRTSGSPAPRPTRMTYIDGLLTLCWAAKNANKPKTEKR